MNRTTKLTFFKSYYELGWWAARVPQASDWDGHEIGLIGFGETQTQAERDLVRREQASGAAEVAELSA